MMGSTTSSSEDREKRKQSKARRVIGGALVLVFWLLVWHLIAAGVGLRLLLPGPAPVLKRLGQLFVTARFYQTVLFTMGRILAGFFSAAAVGSLLAALTTSLPFFHRLLAPLLGVIKATPVASFILLCLIWLSSSNTVVLCSFLMVLPLIWANVSAGIESVDPQLLEMGRVFHFSRWKRIRYLYLPAALPYFTAAVSNGLGFAWKSGVAAEVLGSPRPSMGRELYSAKITLEFTDLFAWTAVVVLVSILMEKFALALIAWMKKRL